MGRALIVGLVALAAAGCGTHRDRVSALVATDLGGHGLVRALDRAAANGREAPLEAIAPLLPSPLPRPVTQTGRCDNMGVVQVRFAGGRTVRYGPCARPLSIQWLQLALTSEARQWSSPTVPATRIVGGLPAEQVALRRILVRMEPTRIRSVRFAPSGSGVTLTVGAGPSLRGGWEAALLGARYAAAAERNGLRPVGRVASQDGTSAPSSQPYGRQRDLAPIRRFLAPLGVRVVELRRQSGATAVTLRSDHVAAFLKHHGGAFVELLRRLSPQAEYVGVEDAAGALVYAWGGLPSEGMFWARPDLDACGPIVHSTPAFYRGPPCPAR